MGAWASKRTSAGRCCAGEVVELGGSSVDIAPGADQARFVGDGAAGGDGEVTPGGEHGRGGCSPPAIPPERAAPVTQLPLIGLFGENVSPRVLGTGSVGRYQLVLPVIPVNPPYVC